MLKESEFYDQLFESYNSLQNKSNTIELWKIHQINELMNTFHDKNNSGIVQNGLIVIMAIFDGNLKDTYFLKSTNIKNLDDMERKIVYSILREELFT